MRFIARAGTSPGTNVQPGGTLRAFTRMGGRFRVTADSGGASTITMGGRLRATADATNAEDLSCTVTMGGRLRATPVLLRPITYGTRMRGTMSVKGPIRMGVTMTATAGSTAPINFGYFRDFVLAGQADLAAETFTGFVIEGWQLSGTWLKNVSITGGRIQSSAGWDLRFEDQDGNKLSHALLAYDGTAGTATFDLRIPTWAVQSDFRFKIKYGNSALTVTEADPAGCWQRSVAAWTWPAGTDISGRGRSLTTTGVTAGTPAASGAFSASSTARVANPSWAALATSAFEATITPTAFGRAIEIGSATNLRVDLTLLSTGSWRLQRSVGTATQVSVSASGAAVLGSTYHIVASCPSGAENQLFINGVDVPLTSTGANLTGAITVASSDNIYIGKAPAYPDITVTNWWDLPRRSGRDWAAGPAYWMGSDNSATNADITADEADVALIDGGAGSSRSHGNYSVPGSYVSNCTDWHGLIGGDVGGVMDITNTHMDWNPNVLFGIGDIVAQLPTGIAQGAGWICHVVQSIPDNRTTEPPNDTTPGDNTIWTEIIAGTHDDKYQQWGKNYVAKMTAIGHPLSRLLIDMNHEMNQSNVFQINTGQEANYKAAIMRTMQQMRIGAAAAGGGRLRFIHRPAWSNTQNCAAYNTWIPFSAVGADDSCDVLSLSVHPDNTVTSNADVTRLLTNAIYSTTPSKWGIPTLLSAADSTGLPIAFTEWSPKFRVGQGCPVSNTFLARFYDEVLVAQKARMVCDFIYKENVRNTAGYEDTGSAAIAQWAAMVATRKTKWSGIKS